MAVLTILLCSVAAGLVSCGRQGAERAAQVADGEADDSSPANPLYVEPSSRDFSSNPDLLDRVAGSAHGYFRFINHLFSSEVCRRFAAGLPGTPSFNLHGDAHMEQYAVTSLGRGLTDFDDSTTGPAVIDLARVGVSLRLICRSRGIEAAECDGLFAELLRGYRAALADPLFEAGEPTVSRREHAGFGSDREGFLAWTESIMGPIEPPEQEELHRALEPYFDAMRSQNPDAPDDFFGVVSSGSLSLGIGSALDLKYLVRVVGSSEDPADDVVLEVKQVRDLTGIECVSTTQRLDPFRILVGQSRIAYEPYRYLGYIRHRELTFWVHAWVDNYKELDYDEMIESTAELGEIVFDIGVQLGRGHPNQIAAPLDEQLRREQMMLLDRDQAMIERTVRELADLTVEAWTRFRDSNAASRGAG